MADSNSTRRQPRFKDLTGKPFGKWTVLRYAGRPKNIAQWLCQCECGNTTTVDGPSLTRGGSAGCRQCSGVGVVTHGMSNSPEFSTWRGMIERCTNTHHKSYFRYGGQQVSVCERWMNSFEAFYGDMGPRPKGCSLDRYPNAQGDYCPENCRWANSQQQARNTKRNRYLTLNGETKLLIEWAETLGISDKTLRTRLRDGWSVERALTTPVKSCKS